MPDDGAVLEVEFLVVSSCRLRAATIEPKIVGDGGGALHTGFEGLDSAVGGHG